MKQGVGSRHEKRVGGYWGEESLRDARLFQAHEKYEETRYAGWDPHSKNTGTCLKTTFISAVCCILSHTRYNSIIRCFMRARRVLVLFLFELMKENNIKQFDAFLINTFDGVALNFINFSVTLTAIGRQDDALGRALRHISDGRF